MEDNRDPNSVANFVFSALVRPGRFDRIVSVHLFTPRPVNLTDTADVIYILAGIMTAVEGLDIVVWFKDSFGSIIDGAVSVYATYLESVSVALAVNHCLT